MSANREISLVILFIATVGLSSAQAQTLTQYKPVAAIDSGHVTIHAAPNALDGDFNSRWLAEGAGNWAQFDLGQSRSIGQVKIAFSSAKTYSLEFMVSSNGSQFSSAGGVRSGSIPSLGFVTFNVAATGRYFRIVGRGPWVNATEVQFYGGAVSPTPAPVRIKWHPGHYVWPSGSLSDTPDNRTFRFNFLNSIGSETAVEGIQLIAYWGDLEGDTPGDYSKGFAMIDAYLEKLASLPLPKRLMIGVQDRVFGRPDPNMRFYYPGYVVDNGWVDIKPANSTLAGGLYSTAMIWKPAVMDRIIALTKAYGARYNKHPMVEMFSLSETSVTSPSGAGGFSMGAYDVQLKRLCDAGKPAWPNTQLRLVANFYGSDTQMRSLIDYCAAAGGVSVGGPDPELPLPVVSRTIQSNRVFRGEAGGSDLRGIVPWVGEQQGMGLGDRYTETPQEIFTYQSQVMQASYIIWLQNNYTGGAEQRWSTGILPFIRATTLKVRTACPKAFGSRCDARD